MTPEAELVKWLKSLDRPITYAAIAVQADRLGADINRIPIQWIYPADDALWGWRSEDSNKNHRKWGFVL